MFLIVVIWLLTVRGLDFKSTRWETLQKNVPTLFKSLFRFFLIPFNMTQMAKQKYALVFYRLELIAILNITVKLANFTRWASE